jgi:hypothetical protein
MLLLAADIRSPKIVLIISGSCRIEMFVCDTTLMICDGQDYVFGYFTRVTLKFGAGCSDHLAYRGRCGVVLGNTLQG